MHWGKGIALFYGVFVTAMIFAVIMSTQQDNSLVSEQYYLEDIKYQEQFNKVKNSQELKNPLQINYLSEEEILSLNFPENFNNIKGVVFLFCPSDPYADERIEFSGKDIIIPTHNFKRALYKVKVSWENDEKSYFDEKTIVFQ